ncbi:T9SS type A sorting domain-containing protein [Subsaximicrobium wynnwilliamsii]|uniref:T9SS type A sorting domain-containing protein n=1 Tax=Subsaximicrobium wynnwilliamsii TaxID=291179 RepID=A0A5C6ZHC6_9FLAO|nr:T9SS type A sorting domain-containing protein [Subsaximicrobium wynnwilliamsii]TXD82398.1 T9SS type A sorting domain-containing protein [Subsaximicrobium wynnwilliamsii]TXD88040.1 T9SS type A sorting domain-containing protein [Subsaximicrobium wynnwilliamsii]TXE02098.1 T9SS type A sorting domain-containing protein [Subsaximicrobium wynnwilliamsii]
MKKITFLFTMVIATSSIFGQVLSEDFESGLAVPSGWTVEDVAMNTPPEIWTIETGGEAGGFTAGNTAVYDNGGDGNYATFDSDGYGNNGTAEESTLTSPVFDCSSLSSVTLSFATVYNGNFGGQGVIEVYNGTAWVNLITYATEAGGAPSTTLTGIQILDVPQLVGVSNAQIRFVWTGNWSISWTIDNISVFECTETESPSTVSAPSPADGAEDVSISAVNNGLTFSWTEGSVTSASFTLNFGTANPPAQSFEGFSNGGTITGLQENTQYFWSVDPVNCFGTTTGTVYSFTTGTVLSVDKKEVTQFTVFPNPVNDKVEIITKANIDHIIVTNQLGQQMMSVNASALNGNMLDMSSLTAGMYFISVSSENKTETIKIIKR